MIVRPDLQCESPYFHGLWYFYLSALPTVEGTYSNNFREQRALMDTGCLGSTVFMICAEGTQSLPTRVRVTVIIIW